MTAALIGEGRESMIVAWTKAEATVAPATWAFNDDEEGEIARERLYRALARGEAVDLTGGITVRADPAPRAIKTIMGELTPDALHRATLSITPAPETVPLTVCLSGHPLRQRFDFNLRAAPPKPLDDGAWVGLASGVPVRGIPRGREASHDPSSIQPDALHDALGSGERDGHDDNAGVAHASAAHREPARRR